MIRHFFALSILVLSTTIVAKEVSTPGEYVWTSDTLPESSEPPLWDTLRQSPPKPMVSIESADKSAASKLERLGKWNKERNKPMKNGIHHELRSKARVSFGPGASLTEGVSGANQKNQKGQVLQTANGDLLWSASVSVDNSYRLRLHLKDVELSENVELWVYSDSGESVGPFGYNLIDDAGNLWTPSVAGPNLSLVVLVPGENYTADFVVEDVVELFKLDSAGQPLLNQIEASDLSCLEETQCITSSTYEFIDGTELSVALIQFVESGDSFVCSGGLITDTDEETNIPYFLTANHCIGTQAVASSLEAFWDFKPSNCGGAAPNPGSVPRSNGSTLVVTGSGDDFSLLELNSIPDGRWLMGWDSRLSAIEAGTTLHRISHPDGMVQQYSQTRIEGGDQFCSSWPRSSNIYQTQILGGIAGGSSGAPVFLDTGQIVGNLRGACGDNIGDDCDYSNFIVDGALNSYWAAVSPFLSPGDIPPADLAVTIVDAVNGTYSPGDTLVVENKVENIGGTVSGTYRITFYASTNTIISSTDHQLGFIDRGAVEPAQNHYFDTTNALPGGLPPGKYYIGALLTTSDGNKNNDSNYDTTQITISSWSSFQINAGLNGSWFNPATAGQGFFIDVLPKIGKMFLSWFTYDTVRPPGSYQANLQEPGHRWITAFGNFNHNQAVLDIDVSQGGVFDSSAPAPTHRPDGSISVEFRNCSEGTVTYNIPSINRQGVVPIQRLASDNVELCEALDAEALATQNKGNPAVDKVRALEWE